MKHNIVFVGVIVAVIGIAGMWATNVSAEREDWSSGHQSAADDLRWLFTNTEHLYETSQVKVTITHSGIVSDINVGKLIHIFDGMDVERGNLHQLDSAAPMQLQAVKQLNGNTAVKVTLLRQFNSPAYLIIRLISAHPESVTWYEKWLQETEYKLVQAGITARWKLAMQGKWPDADSPDDIEELQWDGQTLTLGKYADNGTINITYRHPDLNASVPSAEHEINLQAELHKHTETDDWLLTVGVPLIVTE